MHNFFKAGLAAVLLLFYFSMSKAKQRPLLKKCLIIEDFVW